jgi:hypothetical protein
MALVLAAFSGCASSADNKQLNQKVSEETAVKETKDLQKTTTDVIQTAPGLSSEQRAQLTTIRDEVRESAAKLHTESLQLRSVLIKDVISADDHDAEIKLIKTRLKKIEDKRLENLFKAIDRANVVLGKQAAENQKMLEETLREDRMDAHIDSRGQ